MAKKSSKTQEQDWDTTPAQAEVASSEAPDGTAPASWGDEPEEIPSHGTVEAEPSQDDWNAVPPPLTLNISMHSGAFDTEHTKMLFYGETGTQKTRTAASMPNVIFADIDHGMSSVDWEVAKVHIDDNSNGLQQLRDLHRFLKAGNHEYETVVLDTLNEMQRVIMRFTIEEFTQVRRSYGSLPGMSDYGYMLSQFMDLTRDFIALPMRVVLLAQVNSAQFDTDVLMPQLVGKNTTREIARKMDVIGFIHSVEYPEGVIPEMCFSSAQYITKDRSNCLPAALPHPTYDRMAAFWK